MQWARQPARAAVGSCTASSTHRTARDRHQRAHEMLPLLTEETESKHDLECANALALHRIGVLPPSQVGPARTSLWPAREARVQL